MSQWVMNYNFTILPQYTLRSLNIFDINSNIEERNRNYFDANIQLKLGDSLSPTKYHIEEQQMYTDNNKR